VNKAAEQRGMIKGVSKSIAPEHRPLRDGVDQVLSEVRSWMDRTKDLDWTEDLPLALSWPSRGHFAEDLDRLAGLVEFAFSEADESMATEESELRERYLRLSKGLQQAREQRNLSSLDHQRLDDELAKVGSNRERLKNALTTHHSWQEVHNKMQALDSARDTDRFEQDLDLYRITGMPKLIALVDRELGQGATDTCYAFGDDMRRLKEFLEKLQKGDGAAAFDKMRKPFEDAFYCVDKRTLDEVNGAEKRVVALGEWLDGLAAERPKSK